MTNDNKQPGYILKKHIVKFLTFWIFPEILRKYAAVACVGASASAPSPKRWLNI